MSLEELRRRAYERRHPPSDALIAARKKQLAAGNHPSQTRLPDEMREESYRCRLSLLSPLQALQRRLAQRARAEG